MNRNSEGAILRGFSFQTLQQDEMTGAAFHPLDDNLMITHGKGHLTFWTRRKDGFFERTDIIKPVNGNLIKLKMANFLLENNFCGFSLLVPW